MTTRPYKVSVLGGGTRRFAKLDSAVAFARKQAASSWAQEYWLVWDTSVPTGEPKFMDGTPNPYFNLGVCVRMVAADGHSWDPFAPVEYIDLR